MLSLQQTIQGSEKGLARSHVLERILLFSGIFSSIWYIAINIIVPLQYSGYNVASYTVSELSAVDAPTRSLWVTLCVLYSLLLITFGIGIWLSAGLQKTLRFVAALFIFDAVFGFFWPPMHQREVIAAGGATSTDTMHLLWAYITLGLMLLRIGFGAAAFGKKFRVFSIVAVILFLVFGLLTGLEAPGIDAGKPTPYIGIWERINIGVYMVWVVVFAIALVRRSEKQVADPN